MMPLNIVTPPPREGFFLRLWRFQAEAEIWVGEIETQNSIVGGLLVEKEGWKKIDMGKRRERVQNVAAWLVLLLGVATT